MNAMKQWTIIYCLKDPSRRNRVFYVGKTSRNMVSRMRGHLYSSTTKRLRNEIDRIISAGHLPTIHQIERWSCPKKASSRELFWIRKYDNKKGKLVNSIHIIQQKKRS